MRPVPLQAIRVCTVRRNGHKRLMVDAGRVKLYLEWDLEKTHEENHDLAMVAMCKRLAWTPSEYVAGVFHEDTYYVCDQGTRTQLETLTAWCTGGGRYKESNPYCIPEITNALKVIGTLEGCDYLSANQRASHAYYSKASP